MEAYNGITILYLPTIMLPKMLESVGKIFPET
jgi:hypothetical protein